MVYVQLSVRDCLAWVPVTPEPPQAPDPWTLDPGPRTLDPGPWTLDPGPRTLDPGPWTLDPSPRPRTCAGMGMSV